MKLPVFIEDYRLSIHGDGKKDVSEFSARFPERSEETRTAIVTFFDFSESWSRINSHKRAKTKRTSSGDLHLRALDTTLFWPSTD